MFLIKELVDSRELQFVMRVLLNLLNPLPCFFLFFPISIQVEPWSERLSAVSKLVMIIFSARFAYDFENIDNDTVTSIADQIDVKTVRLGLQNRLVDSTSVDIFLGTIHKLPANSLGFIPSDFQISIELLEDAKEEEEDNDDDE